MSLLNWTFASLVKPSKCAFKRGQSRYLRVRKVFCRDLLQVDVEPSLHNFCFIMKRSRNTAAGSAASSADEAPAKRLKVHKPSGYTFEFVNDVKINEGEVFMPVPESVIKNNKTFVSNQGRFKSSRGVIITPKRMGIAWLETQKIIA